MTKEQQEFCRGIPIFSILSVRGEEFVARLIRFWEQGFSNHTAIYIGKGKNLIVEASPRRAVNYSYITKYLNDKYQVIVYENPDLTNSQIERLKDVLYDMQAKTEGYSFLGLLGFLVPWIKSTPTEKFCSETAVKLFYDALHWRLFPVDTDINHVSPADFDEFMIGNENRRLLENGLVDCILKVTDEAKSLGWTVGRFWDKGNFRILTKKIS